MALLSKEQVRQITLDGFHDDEAGNTDDFGFWVALVRDEGETYCYVVNGQGFDSLTVGKRAEEQWQDLSARYEQFLRE